MKANLHAPIIKLTEQIIKEKEISDVWFLKDWIYIFLTVSWCQHNIIQPYFTSNAFPTLSFKDDLKDIQMEPLYYTVPCGMYVLK